MDAVDSLRIVVKSIEYYSSCQSFSIAFAVTHGDATETFVCYAEPEWELEPKKSLDVGIAQEMVDSAWGYVAPKVDAWLRSRVLAEHFKTLVGTEYTPPPLQVDPTPLDVVAGDGR